MSTSSTSGRTATVAAEVWILPPASVAGIRWTRWTPDSNLSLANTPFPEMEAEASLIPPRPVSLSCISSNFHP